MVSSVPNLQEEHGGVFEGCVLGENVKKPFLSNKSRSKEILDLVNSNVCCLMPVKSLGGYLYYVTFIDDFSRNTWIYFMNTKDKAFNKFQEFKLKCRT